MFKKKYYIILGISVVTMVSVFAIVINKSICETKTIPTQVEKETLKNPIEAIREHIEKGENDLAITLANRYLESDPTNIKIINLLTEAYINKNDLSTAETIVKKSMAIKPDDPWSYKTLAHIYRIKGNKEKDANIKSSYFSLALEQIEKGLTYNPDNVWLLGEATQIYSEQGDIVKANQTIDKALNISPDNTFLKTIKEKINSPITEKEEIKK